MNFGIPGTSAERQGIPHPGRVNPTARPHGLGRIIFTAAGLAFSGFWSFDAQASQETAAKIVPPPKTGLVGDVSLSFESETAKPDLALGATQERTADALAHYIDGLMAEDDGNSDQALAAYEKVLTLDPGGVDPKLTVRVSSEYIRRGDIAQGISLLKDAIKAQPKEPLPYISVAYIYLKQLQKPDLAWQYAKMAVEVAPYDLRSHQALFVVLDSQGRTAEAEKAVDYAASVESNDSEYWFGIADLYLRMYARENREDQIAPDKLQKVTAIFQKALTKNPENPGVLSRVADFYYKIGDNKTAIPLYLKAVAENSGATESLQADIREKLAKTFFSMGKRQEAIEMLQALIKLNPLKSDAYIMLGDIYSQANDLGQALVNYQQALLTDQTEPQNYLRVARTALQSKKPQVAIDALVEAQSKFGSPQITTLLAVAYSEAGQVQEALVKFQQAEQEAQDYDGNPLTFDFYLSYADAAQKAGLVEKTVELLRKSIEMDPQTAHEGQNFLGYFWIDRGENLDEAVQLVRLALMAQPDNGAYLDSLGWYYYKKGSYDLAIKQLLKAAEHLPEEDAVVDEHIADTYLKLGKTAEALDYWKRALHLDPGNKSLATKIDAHQEKVTANPAASSTR